MNKFHKNIFLISFSLLSFCAYSQAKKPTIMVVPSDTWCIQNGYSSTYNIQGTIMKLPEYKRALQEDAELLLVISKINELMSERGFPLKNLESSLKSIQYESAVDAGHMSKSGSEISETPIDKLKKVAKADIWMQITWSINQTGPKKSVTFNLQGIDAYTDKQIAGASGTGTPSFSAEIPVLLEESILANLDNFNAQLSSHFDDLFENGREVTLRIKKWELFEEDLESVYDGTELGFIIEDWVSDNTVHHRFNTTDATENMMLLEQVRIPLYDDNNRPLDTRRWANNLKRMLREKYNITSKLDTYGLGQVSLIIGDK